MADKDGQQQDNRKSSYAPRPAGRPGRLPFRNFHYVPCHPNPDRDLEHDPEKGNPVFASLTFGSEKDHAQHRNRAHPDSIGMEQARKPFEAGLKAKRRAIPVNPLAGDNP
jgi:hypothetical protein